MPIVLDSLDHVVLTVASIDKTIAFYERVLGMTAREFKPQRYALHFGAQKINLHEVGTVVDPNVRHATPGSGDLCFLTRMPLEDVIDPRPLSEGLKRDETGMAWYFLLIASVYQGVARAAAEELKKRLRDVALSAPQRVELDFAGVSHIGSAGIGKLLVFYKDLAIHGAVLALMRVPSPIYHLFREMKLDSIFAISEGQ